MLPPINSFKPRVAAPAIVIKKRASRVVAPAKASASGVRGLRIALKRTARLSPQPLVVLGSSKRSISC